MEWNFKNTTSKLSITGYEEVLDKLKTYTRKEFTDESTTEERRQEMIEEVFDIYRGINIFPIKYFNEQGIKKEIQKCIDKDIDWQGNVLDLKFHQGSALCKYMFPNLHTVDCKGAKDNNMWDRFMDNHKLCRAIELSLKIKKSVTPSEIFGALELIGGNKASNFPAMKVKALVERYCPKNGIVLDMSAGFGGRLIGTLTSKNDYKYIGVEPCVETYNQLNKLGQYIEEVKNQTSIFKIYNTVAEDFMLKEEYVDMQFTSPPYFTLEKYSDEDTQCYNKFPNLKDWMEGFVRVSIRNAYKMLKKGGYSLYNISNFNLGKQRVEFVDKWIEIAQEEGFEFVDTITLKLVSRKGTGMGSDGKEKKEGIFVFRK